VDFSRLIQRIPSDLRSQPSHKTSEKVKWFNSNNKNKSFDGYIFKIINSKVNIWICDFLFRSFAFHISTWWTCINFLQKENKLTLIIQFSWLFFTVDRRLSICKCLLLVFVQTAVVTVYSNWWRTRLRLVVSSQSYSGAPWNHLFLFN